MIEISHWLGLSILMFYMLIFNIPHKKTTYITYITLSNFRRFLFPLILIDFRMTVYIKSIFVPSKRVLCIFKILNGCWMYTHFPKRNKNDRILAKTLQHLTNLSHRSTNIILFWKMKIWGVCIGGGGYLFVLSLSVHLPKLWF